MKSTATLHATFGDPTREAIVRLRAGPVRTVGEVAARLRAARKLPASRPDAPAALPVPARA